MFPHQRKSQAGAFTRTTFTGPRAAGETFEYSLGVRLGNTLAGVLHGEPQVTRRIVGRKHMDGGRTTTVRARIVDEIGHHSCEAPTVAMNSGVATTFVEMNRGARHAAGKYRLLHELTDL
jgi:hypothetical protein